MQGYLLHRGIEWSFGFMICGFNLKSLVIPCIHTVSYPVTSYNGWPWNDLTGGFFSGYQCQKCPITSIVFTWRSWGGRGNWPYEHCHYNAVWLLKSIGGFDSPFVLQTFIFGNGFAFACVGIWCISCAVHLMAKYLLMNSALNGTTIMWVQSGCSKVMLILRGKICPHIRL